MEAFIVSGWGPVAHAMSALPTATIARVLLVLMFPFSALDKMLFWKDGLAQAGSSIVPAVLAPAMLVCGMACELVLPVCIVFGWYAEQAAFLLAGYCAVTALLFHAFWRWGDLMKPGESKARSHFWDFTKNFGLAGGLLLVASGHGF